MCTSMPLCLHTHTHTHTQVEIDFKAECQAGNRIESLCHPLAPKAQPASNQGTTSSSNGTSSASKSSAAAAAAAPAEALPTFLHSLRRCDDSGECYELVRCRTKWRPAV